MSASPGCQALTAKPGWSAMSPSRRFRTLPARSRRCPAASVKWRWRACWSIHYAPPAPFTDCPSRGCSPFPLPLAGRAIAYGIFNESSLRTQGPIRRGLSFLHWSRGLLSLLRPGVMGPCVRRDDPPRDCAKPRHRLKLVICDSPALAGEGARAQRGRVGVRLQHRKSLRLKSPHPSPPPQAGEGEEQRILIPQSVHRTAIETVADLPSSRTRP